MLPANKTTGNSLSLSKKYFTNKLYSTMINLKKTLSKKDFLSNVVEEILKGKLVYKFRKIQKFAK